MRAGSRRLALLALLPALAVLALGAWRARLSDPAPTVLVRDRDGRFLDEVADPAADGVGYWPIHPVPPRVAAATLALEDHRFASHPGVDPVAVGRALVEDVRAGRVVSGASTVAMQLARMQSPAPRTLPNKLVEATSALLLTARYGRDAVLEQYLRYAPYGNNIHGIAYAARRYLDKPVEDLSWAETAFLCALPQSPSLTNPFTPEGRTRAVRRAHRILTSLAPLIPPAERALAKADLDHLSIPDRGRRPPEALHAVLQMHAELQPGTLGPTPAVTASLDPALQLRLAGEVNRRVAEWEGRGAGNAAVLVVELATGDVLAHVGSTDYFGTAHAGAIDYTRVRRPAGSTLKPFLYALALDQGALTSATLLDDRAHTPGGIGNADGAALGPLLPRQALGNSRNVSAVAVLERVGARRTRQLYADLGLVPEDGPADEGLAIGGVTVTLQGLVEAATALAADGRPIPLRWWAAPSSPRAAAFTPASARIVTRWLADPLARLPSFPRLGATELPFAAAVKTGTSPDYRDAWAIAWTPRYVVGAWVGDPLNTPMAHLSGYAAAAELAQAALLDLHAVDADGLADRSFPPPEGLAPSRICAHTGALAGERCALVFTEHFLPGAAPTAVCTGETGRSSIASTEALAARVRITSPPNGAWLIRDPEIPADRATVSLEASVEPPSDQLTWYVDGIPIAVEAPPYTTRWRIEPGYHQIEARIPYTTVGATPVRVLGR